MIKNVNKRLIKLVAAAGLLLIVVSVMIFPHALDALAAGSANCTATDTNGDGVITMADFKSALSQSQWANSLCFLSMVFSSGTDFPEPVVDTTDDQLITTLDVPTNKILFFMTNFADNPSSKPVSKNSFETAITGKVIPYYQENSYGNLNYQLAHASDWKTIATSYKYLLTTCTSLIDLSTPYYNEVLRVHDTPSLDFSQYQNATFMFVTADVACPLITDDEPFTFSTPDGNVTAYWSLFTLPANVIENQKLLERTIAHELGHTRARYLYESNLLSNCTGSSIGPLCTSTTYGNNFSIMGYHHDAANPWLPHMGAIYKEMAGWLSLNEISRITPSDKGVFTIGPIEVNPNQTPDNRVRALKIDSNDPLIGDYYVEYRQPIGFDNWPDVDTAFPGYQPYGGAMIYYKSKSEWNGAYSHLGDPIPNAANITVLPGETTNTIWGFTSNATLTTCSANSTTLTVAINAPCPWSQGTAGNGRAGHTGLAYDHKIAYFFGLRDSVAIKDVQIYNVAGNSWSAGAASPVYKVLHDGAIIGNLGLFFGGLRGTTGGYTNVVDVYSFAGNNWRTGTTGGTARGYHTATAYQNKIFIWGGTEQGQPYPTNKMEAYTVTDQATGIGTWSTVGYGGVARYSHTAALYHDSTSGDDKIYFAMGKDNLSDIRDFDIYNITQNSWSKGPALPGNYEVMKNGTASVVGNKIYYFGGLTYTQPTTEYIFDIAANQWSVAYGTPYPGYADLTANVVKNSIYYFGGGQIGSGNMTIHSPSVPINPSPAPSPTPTPTPMTASCASLGGICSITISCAPGYVGGRVLGGTCPSFFDQCLTCIPANLTPIPVN
jgi:hypothetical protein